ncbi:MAG: hypothetical protein WC813_04305 [Patescibacteria group bacterium]|jgi:hypothetical protein
MEDATKNEILTKLDSFQQENRGQFHVMRDEFQVIREEFQVMRDEFHKIHGELKVVDALLHSVSETAQRTEIAVDRLNPVSRDHEERISVLERSTARLRLLVDR